jgi:hypothetical protein
MAAAVAEATDGKERRWRQQPRVYPEATTKEGAEKLADKILSYWRRRGYYNVTADILPVPGDTKFPVYAVRTNLVAGLPPPGAHHHTNLPDITVWARPQHAPCCPPEAATGQSAPEAAEVCRHDRAAPLRIRLGGAWRGREVVARCCGAAVAWQCRELLAPAHARIGAACVRRHVGARARAAGGDSDAGACDASAGAWGAATARRLSAADMTVSARRAGAMPPPAAEAAGGAAGPPDGALEWTLAGLAETVLLDQSIRRLLSNIAAYLQRPGMPPAVHAYADVLGANHDRIVDLVLRRRPPPAPITQPQWQQWLGAQQGPRQFSGGG